MDRGVEMRLDPIQQRRLCLPDAVQQYLKLGELAHNPLVPELDQRRYKGEQDTLLREFKVEEHQELINWGKFLAEQIGRIK